MALETLKGIKEIGGFKVATDRIICAEAPISISEPNCIEFQIQNGPIKENGVNGCQVDTVIETAKIIIEELNKNFHDMHNEAAIDHLGEALRQLGLRKRSREMRGVEGFDIK